MLNADSYFVSDDRRLLDLPRVYRGLHDHCYWAKNLQYDAFTRSVAFSAVVLGAYRRTGGQGVQPAETDLEQVGFARVVSDCATFAYLTDVYVEEPHRGRGLSKRLMEAVMEHPDLQGLRRFLLVTEDAEPLYARYGFRGLGSEAAHWMQRFSG